MEAILKYTGLAGLAISLLFLLFKGIIKKNLFPKLSQLQAYKLLRFIIWIFFFVSLACIITYFALNNNILNPKNSSKPVDTTSKVVNEQNVDIKGNENTVINGSNNKVIKNAQPEYSPEKFDKSTFMDFILENDGRTVYINTSFDIDESEEGIKSQKKDKNSLYHLPYTNVGYIFFGKDQKDIVRGDLSFFSIDYLWCVDVSKETCEWYTDSHGEEHLTIDVGEKELGCLVYDRSTIYIKGTFRVVYTEMGQGHNLIELRAV